MSRHSKDQHVRDVFERIKVITQRMKEKGMVEDDTRSTSYLSGSTRKPVRSLSDAEKYNRSDNGVNKKRRKLSGAAKRKLSRLVQGGMSYSAATDRIKVEQEEKIKLSMDRKSSFSVIINNRNRNTGDRERSPDGPSTSTQSYPSGRHRSRSSSPRPRTSRYPGVRILPKDIKVGILHPGFPREVLDAQQLTVLQKAIITAIEDLPDDGPQIRFSECCVRQGWLSVTCVDEDTRLWLHKAIQQLKPWRDAQLKAVEGDALPRFHDFTVYIPDDVDGMRLPTEKVLKRLKKMNKCLHTEDWRVITYTKSGSGHIWTMSVDEISKYALEMVDFRPYFGFGQIHFQPKSPEGYGHPRPRSRERDDVQRQRSNWMPIKREIPTSAAYGTVRRELGARDEPYRGREEMPIYRRGDYKVRQPFPIRVDPPSGFPTREGSCPLLAPKSRFEGFNRPRSREIKFENERNAREKNGLPRRVYARSRSFSEDRFSRSSWSKAKSKRNDNRRH